METETLASRNIVELMLMTEFGKPGLCPVSSDSEEAKDGFVYGWDC
jgi:hypothetical protein